MQGKLKDVLWLEKGWKPDGNLDLYREVKSAQETFANNKEFEVLNDHIRKEESSRNQSHKLPP